MLTLPQSTRDPQETLTDTAVQASPSPFLATSLGITLTELSSCGAATVIASMALSPLRGWQTITCDSQGSQSLALGLALIAAPQLAQR